MKVVEKMKNEIEKERGRKRKRDEAFSDGNFVAFAPKACGIVLEAFFNLSNVRLKAYIKP